MGTDLNEWVAHPLGEQSEVEEWSTVADTFAGRVHIEWDTTAPVKGDAAAWTRAFLEAYSQRKCGFCGSLELFAATGGWGGGPGGCWPGPPAPVSLGPFSAGADHHRKRGRGYLAAEISLL